MCSLRQHSIHRSSSRSQHPCSWSSRSLRWYSTTGPSDAHQPELTCSRRGSVPQWPCLTSISTSRSCCPIRYRCLFTACAQLYSHTIRWCCPCYRHKRCPHVCRYGFLGSGGNGIDASSFDKLPLSLKRGKQNFRYIDDGVSRSALHLSFPIESNRL